MENYEVYSNMSFLYLQEEGETWGTREADQKWPDFIIPYKGCEYIVMILIFGPYCINKNA